MSEIHESTRKIAEKDQLDYEIQESQQQGLFGPPGWILNPQQEHQINLLNRKLQSEQETIADLKKKLQHYKDKIEQRLLENGKASPAKGKKTKPLTKDELLRELKALQDTEELDILKRKLAEAEQSLAEATEERNKAQAEYSRYKQDQEEILTEYQADSEIQKKVSQLQTLRARFDSITNKLAGKQVELQKLERQIEEHRAFYNESLVPQYNALVQEVSSLRKQVQSLRAEKGRLGKLKAIPKTEPKQAAPSGTDNLLRRLLSKILRR